MELRGLSATDRTPLVGQALARVSREMDCTIDEAWAVLWALSGEQREGVQAIAANVIANGVRSEI